MNRRAFMSTLGGAAACSIAWPLAARAQQGAMPVIGFLNSASPGGYARPLAAFRDGLKETGFVEGPRVAIEYRWAEGRYDRLPALAADLVQRRVGVIATGGTPSAHAAKAATTTVPIVFSTVANPVDIGLVTSLARPGGNITGVTSLGVELGAKRLELLHQLRPAAKVVGLLINPTNTNAAIESREAQAAARALDLELRILEASRDGDLALAFAALVTSPAGGLVISPDPFFTSRIEQLAALGLRNAVPVIYQYREFTAGGGLMSYGGSLAESYRLVGIYTGRVLKGERPADLPVQQSTKVELLVNLVTAKALGIEVPQPLLARADEVIE